MVVGFNGATLNSAGNGFYVFDIYFLVNRRDKSLYIGQSDNIYSRLLQHNRKFNENFTEAYGITYVNNKVSKTSIDYLEYYYINKFNDGDG